MLTSPAQRAPKSNLVAPIVLGIVLIPLTQLGVDYLGARWGSFMVLLVGTPACYFLIGGLAAFTTVRGLGPAQARGRGAWVGFIAGISGACSALVVAVAFAAWYVVVPTQPTSLAHPQSSVMPRISYAAMMGPGFTPIVVVFIVLPYFLGVNLFGIGLAPLGGMLGGYLRARLSPEMAPPLERIGEGERARSKRGILVITIVAVLLAIMVIAAGLLYAAGDFAASAG